MLRRITSLAFMLVDLRVVGSPVPACRAPHFDDNRVATIGGVAPIASGGDAMGECGMERSPQILGIVNVTRDSFSDGGRFLDPATAIAHAQQLLADGADIIDVGAESTHPDSEDVPAEEQIARLTPVVRALLAEGARVSVDTSKADVMRAVLRLGVEFINDVTALADRDAIKAVRKTSCRLILMHALRRADAHRAAPVGHVDPEAIINGIVRFMAERSAALEADGIARERLIF